MTPHKEQPLTDLDRFIRAVELARKASRSRVGREITTSEMPELLSGVFAAERIIAGLFEVSIGKETANAQNDHSDDLHGDNG